MPPGIGGDLEFSLVFKAVDQVSNVLGGIVGALESVISTTANFQTGLNRLQSNTTLTAADMDKVRASVLALNAQSGAPLDQLTTGFMRVADVGNNVADSAIIMKAAMESALPTGANLADVAGVLSLQMHDFGIQAGMATNVMNVLHLSAAESRTTLQDFSDSTAKATAEAAVLKLPLVEADAALAALTLHMGSASDASTALYGFLSKLAAPTGAQEKAIVALSKASGVDLVNDFTSVGLTAKGLPAVLDDVRRATNGNVQEMLKLVPAARGGLAEMVLLGTGSADYTRILKDLNAAMAGQTNATLPAYQQYLHSFNGEMAQLQAAFTQFTLTVGQPILSGLMPDLNLLMTYLAAHKADITAFGTAIGTDIAGGVKTFVTEVTTHQTQIEAFVKSFAVDLASGVKSLVADLPSLVSNFTQLVGAIQAMGTAMGTISGWLNNAPGLSNALSGAPLSPGTTSILGGLFTFNPNNSLLLHPPGTSGSPWGGVGTASADTQHVPLSHIDPVTGKPYVLPTTRLPFLTPFSGATGSAAPVSSVERDAAGNIIAYGGGGPSYHAPPGAPPAPKASADPAFLAWQQAQKEQQAAANAALAAQIAQVNQSQAQGALKDAQQRLQIDQLMNAPQAKLLADIKTILTDFSAPILGNSPTAIQLEGLQLQKQIATATTKTAVMGGPYASFAANQYASEGSTIAAFGSPGRNAQAEMIGHLRQLLASADKQIALLTGMLTSSQRQAASSDLGAKAGVATAQNTGKLAAALSGPHQASDPRSSHGLVAIHR